jgi:hypothetical protein
LDFQAHRRGGDISVFPVNGALDECQPLAFL